MDALEGRTAVVTGAAGGLGKAIANRLALAGARIIAIDIEAALAQTTLPAEWQQEAIDLGAPDSMMRMRGMAEKLGVVDVVVANAGLVPPWRSITEVDPAEWQSMCGVSRQRWGVLAWR